LRVVIRSGAGEFSVASGQRYGRQVQRFSSAAIKNGCLGYMTNTPQDLSYSGPKIRTEGVGTQRRNNHGPNGSTRPAGVRRVQVGSPTTPRIEEPDAQWPGDRPDELPLPDPTGMCCSVVRAAAEVLAGMRAPSQLANWVTPQVHDQLVARVTAMRQAVDQGVYSPEPRSPIHVRRVRLDRHGDTAEATVILESAGRLRAAAARLEARRGQWRLAVLDLA